jgi:anti-sigma regulatory factor (Ser/Thr protein kinase)
MPGSVESQKSYLTIPARPDAGAIARRAISTWLGSHPRLDDALLAVTELVNNAVVHGGLADGEDLTITMQPEGNGIRLTVRHAGVPFEVTELPPQSLDPNASRGLAIVAQIADRWGVDSDGTAVTAWFEVSPGTVGQNGR